MRKLFLKSLGLAALMCLAIFSMLLFLPKHYAVPQMQKRESTRYWNLPTGSQIGYTLVSAKGQRKPYPIIFLQGGPGGVITGRNIEMLSPLAQDGYDVYLYDQIGSGQSARLNDITDYTTERHKKDLEEIVKQIGAEKVILIGQSWGAILAVLFAAGHPEKIAQIIFTSPGPVQPVRTELSKRQAPDSMNLKSPLFTNAEANEKVFNIRMKAASFFATVFGKKLVPDSEADQFQTCLNNELNKSTVCDTAKALKAEGGGGFYVQVMTVRSFNQVKDPRPELKNSPIPVLVMKGQCDNQKWGYTNEYLELFPNHQLKVIPNAGHSISIEQPELYLKTLREFLFASSPSL